jgi:hypothetical protein
LQCGFDYARYAGSHSVLKLEDVFEGPVEAIGPEMRAGKRINQLPGDADPLTRFAN